MLQFLWHAPRKAAALFVRLYQKTLSPDHSLFFKKFFPNGYCKFQPTCSQYMIDALLKYGFIRGLGKGLARIIRCNPWNEGGPDAA